MNMKLRSIIFATALSTTFSLAANAAIIPVGGTLHAYATAASYVNSPPDVILGSSYGLFNTSASQSDPVPTGSNGYAGTSAEIRADKLELKGYASSYLQAGAWSSATVDFALSESTTWHLQFLSDNRSDGSSLSLNDSDGNVVFTSSCFRTGICSSPGSPWSNAYLFLAAGTYSLSVVTTTGWYQTSVNANSLSVVMTTPIPAALPLFGSALVGLALVNRRRKALR